MSSACPRCHVTLPVPLPSACGSCGLVLMIAVDAPTAPLQSPPIITSEAGPATGPVTGPHLSGRWDGKVNDFALSMKTTLGRHPANTLRLADREVSKEHATIEKVGDAFFLRDLGSSNGTFVNGRRVKELRLKDGDEIALGSSRLTFKSGEGAHPLSPPGVTVVHSAQSIPAFLAQLDAVAAETEFRPADQLKDTQALKQDYEKLRIAHEFHRQIGLERDQKSLLDKILKVAFQLLAADHGVLFLTDATGKLVPKALRRRNEESTEEVMLSDTVLKRVQETRQAVLTADAILDSRFSGAESIVAQGIRSAMAVPLLVNGDLKGCLFLDTRERINAFSEKDLKLLSAVASQAAIALENADLARKIEVEAVTRAELSRFLSPAIADMVVRGQVELLRAGRMAEVSVLFADIRGFTTMSEQDEPQDVVNMLNSFFTAMANVVFRHEGNLDKFIGDCVMAVWGPPSPHQDDPGRALRAALEMQVEVDALNATRVSQGKPAIQVGIGVNTGQAVVGYMGSTERHEFTAIGDSVNTASRLCGMAKGGEVLATENTVQRAGPGFDLEQLPLSHVKGKEKGVVTFRVRGIELTSSGLLSTRQ